MKKLLSWMKFIKKNNKLKKIKLQMSYSLKKKMI